MYLRKNLGSIRQDCFNVPHGMKNAPFRNFVLHSDNGGAMRSCTLLAKCTYLAY